MIRAEKDKFADEVMSDEELDQVAGGNWNEYKELQSILPYAHTTEFFSGFVRIDDHPMKKNEIQDWLKINLNIEATVDGSPWEPGKYANVYKRNGKDLNHNQVVAEVRQFLGK